MHPLSLPSSLLAALWSSLWTFCFSQLPDLFPLLTGLLACAPWVLPGLVLGVSLPLLLAFFLCTPPGGLG